MAQATLSCRYAAIHLVYLGIYTREEKMCLQGAFFLRNSIESVVSIERLSKNVSFSTASKEVEKSTSFFCVTQLVVEKILPQW